MMNDALLEFLIVYGTIVVVALIFTIVDISGSDSYDDRSFCRTPAYYYENTSYNYAGAIFLFLLYFIVNPLGSICIFFDWLFRLGK